MKNFIIAVDGYSSSGKSTLAKQIAGKLGFVYVDSGAMYRAVTLFCLENGAIENNEAVLSKVLNLLDQITIDFRYNPSKQKSETLLNGRNVEKEIRENQDVAGQVSNISKIKEVREKLVDIQRAIANEKNIVMDGRDIGTVVFPGADIKVFMDTKPETRARRRYQELLEKGIHVEYGQVLENIRERDFIDENRDESPLKKAKDAVTLDNGEMSLQDQLDWFMNLYNQKTGGA